MRRFRAIIALNEGTIDTKYISRSFSASLHRRLGGAPPTSDVHKRHLLPQDPFLGRAFSAQPETQSTSSKDVEYDEGPMVLYTKGLKSGKYRLDPRQANTMNKLQRLYNDLSKAFPRSAGSGGGLAIVDAIDTPQIKSNTAQTSWWQSLVTAVDDETPPSAPEEKTVQGLYMFGGVGCGKTMLMDLFILSSPPRFKVKRVHFHDFMLDIHARLRRHARERDPLVRVAEEYLRSCRVLCLDELMVTDVADAMILHRLFDQFWAQGLVLVSTSNRPPDGLYENGLQRALFLPFIRELKERCVTHDMNSGTDYRKLAKHVRGMYYIKPDRNELLTERFQDFAQDQIEENVEVEVMMGRTIVVPKAGIEEKVALFTFDELCNKPVGASDYIALASKFHTVCLMNLPVISHANRSAAHRLVTLIDVFYEHRIRLLCSADAPVFQIFERVSTNKQLQELRAAKRPSGAPPLDESTMVVDDVLGFSKDRTVSRLTEMQSQEYLRAHAQAHCPELLPALEEELTQAKMRMVGT